MRRFTGVEEEIQIYKIQNIKNTTYDNMRGFTGYRVKETSKVVKPSRWKLVGVDQVKRHL